jgi:outer membrane receptor protein involved in Fe transport
MKNPSLSRRRPLRAAASLLGALAALAAPPPLLAQADSAEVELAPVVVTADLWATPLARMPASVTVLDAAALARHGTAHFGDLVEGIPNLTWTGGTSRPRHLQLRGLGENSQYEGETPDASVRFLVDDLDFTGLGALGGTFDLEQVEVLRGPQAGAFGAHAAGGVVRLVTAAPTPYWTGRVEATVGDQGRRTAGLAVGGPLSETNPETLTFRLALQHHEDHGFRRNLTLNPPHQRPRGIRRPPAAALATARGLDLGRHPAGRWHPERFRRVRPRQQRPPHLQRPARRRPPRRMGRQPARHRRGGSAHPPHHPHHLAAGGLDLQLRR